MQRSPSLWLGTMTLLIVAAVTLFRLTPDAWPYGDDAVTQIYVLQALRGALVQGPYSQFGWHHPGPVLFYLLAPTYVFSGERAIGLTVGAEAINSFSIWLVWFIAARNANRLVGGILTLGLGLFAWRARELIGSSWNPHVIVLPLSALLVAVAGLANRDRMCIVIVGALASFVMQTHVSVVPVIAAALVVGIIAGFPPKTLNREVWWWLIVAGAVALLLWLPAILDALTTRGRNVHALWTFFRRPTPPHRLDEAFAAWSAATEKLLFPGFRVPWGMRGFTSSAVLQGAAVGQLLLLGAAWAYARRGESRFLSLLAALLLTTGVVALWAITRIPGDISEYQVVWLSSTGVMMWSTIIAIFASAGAAPLDKAGLHRALGTALLAVSALLVSAATFWTTHDAWRHALAQAEGNVRRKNAALALRSVLSDNTVHPLITISQDVWTEAACVVLDVYKHHPNLAVDGPWVHVFGGPLSPRGTENLRVAVSGSRLHTELATHVRTVTVFSETGFFIDLITP